MKRATALLGVLSLLMTFPGKLRSEDARRIVVCSTYPIHLLTSAVAAGPSALSVELLLPAGGGCPHDYVLTPADMRTLMRAEAVIVNGLGMDDFLRQPLEALTRAPLWIDSSLGLQAEQLPDRHDAVPNHDHDHAPGGPHCGDHCHGKAPETEAAFNPHLFVSPRLAARLVMNLAAELSKLDPAHAGNYSANAVHLAARLNALAAEMSATAKSFTRRRIISEHNSFAYLARDLGLEVVAVIQAHAGQDPVAAELRSLRRSIQDQRVVAIVHAPPSSTRGAAAMLARETGVPLVMLDPLASGPPGGGIDHYETVMRANLETLRKLMQ